MVFAARGCVNVLLLIVAQLAKLIITRFTPIPSASSVQALAFPLEGEGTSSLPLEGES
jgi:hypothetical protein